MQTQNLLLNFVRQISKEKGLDPAVIKEAIEHAMVASSKKNLSLFNDARAELDLETGELNMIVRKRIVERVRDPKQEISLKDAEKIDKSCQVDQEIDVRIPGSDLGRIAAQSARQIIMQRLRDAERERTYEAYKDRAGQIVTGVIQRFERRDAMVNIGDTEGVLPYEEQPYGSRYRFGDRIKCIIQSVEMTPRGPIIRLSRNSTELVLKLFALEVPEIADGVVQVVNIAREPGVRTKLAVSSRNPDVDPVGACVGMKGSRVQMIVREFENEKIDIVPYSANPTTFITAALNPATINRVDLRPQTQTATVIVPQDSLALAIGRRGQNARLGAKLTGWQLEIKSAEEEAEEIAAEEARVHYLGDFLDQVAMSDETRERIADSELNSVEALAEAELTSIVEAVRGPEEAETEAPEPEENWEDLAEQIRENAIGYVEALRQMTEEQEAAEKEAAELEAAEQEAAEQEAAEKANAGEEAAEQEAAEEPADDDTTGADDDATGDEDPPGESASDEAPVADQTSEASAIGDETTTQDEPETQTEEPTNATDDGAPPADGPAERETVEGTSG